MRSRYAASCRASSPLTRGKLLGVGGGLVHGGLIPAHAGKTPQAPELSGSGAAHPRSRGENVVADTKKFSRAGSSPLTQGKQHHRHHRRPQRGLIPTHAGKTRSSELDLNGGGAHPRSRGENFASVLMLRSTVGASPLTQGKRHDPDHHSATTILPRSHGENKQLLVAAASQHGSSPLTRGKRDRLRELRLELGRIPTHTGKTTCMPKR